MKAKSQHVGHERSKLETDRQSGDFSGKPADKECRVCSLNTCTCRPEALASFLLLLLFLLIIVIGWAGTSNTRKNTCSTNIEKSSILRKFQTKKTPLRGRKEVMNTWSTSHLPNGKKLRTLATGFLHLEQSPNGKCAMWASHTVFRTQRVKTETVKRYWRHYWERDIMKKRERGRERIQVMSGSHQLSANMHDQMNAVARTCSCRLSTCLNGIQLCQHIILPKNSSKNKTNSEFTYMYVERILPRNGLHTRTKSYLTALKSEAHCTACHLPVFPSSLVGIFPNGTPCELKRFLAGNLKITSSSVSIPEASDKLRGIQVCTFWSIHVHTILGRQNCRMDGIKDEPSLPDPYQLYLIMPCWQGLQQSAALRCFVRRAHGQSYKSLQAASGTTHWFAWVASTGSTQNAGQAQPTVGECIKIHHACGKWPLGLHVLPWPWE